MSKNNEEMIDQETTNGQFFLNIYGDGSFGIESINGGELRGTSEEWVMIFQALVPRLRKASR